MKMDMITPRELAELTGIQLRTITRLASVGEIPAVKVGRQWRFIRQDVEEWIRTRATNQRRRILIVEDSEELLEQLDHLVRKMGHEPVTATDGVKAVEILRRDPEFDLVILDLLLPLVDGPGVMEWMAKRDVDIDVILITAYADSELMARALRYRHVTVLRKPADPVLIQRAIMTALQGVPAPEDLTRTQPLLLQGK